MIFDTHIHLNDEKYAENLDKYIQSAIKKGVKLFLCIGYDLESSKKAIEIANTYKEVYASVGVIPTEHKQYILKEEKTTSTIDELENLLKLSNKIVAIGEIGLDYYWENAIDIKIKQKKMFLEQIELANKYNLPISIHCRDAIQDTFDILKANKVNKSGIMHCYSGSKEMAIEFAKLGYKIAFGGVLTFKNSVNTKESIKAIKLEDVVFETDAPYLSPVPYRGKINLPEYIVETVIFAAEYLGIEREKLEEISFKNSCEILNINYE